VVFVAATTKAGKSQFGLSCAAKAAMKGLPVLICDSEPTQYIETGFWRMDAAQLRGFGVSAEKIDEILDCGKRMRDPRVWERIEKMPIYYQSTSGMDVSDVIPHMRRWVLSHVKPDRETRVPQCLVVYDYIKLAMTDEIRSGRLQEYQLHGLNVASLHDFTKKYNIPMIAFGQTNNEIDDDLKCIAGAKRISENVGSITLWKRKGDRELAQYRVDTLILTPTLAAVNLPS
jgi:replicative DNA helicase